MFNNKKLESYMKSNGITPTVLAARIGVTEGAVRHILIGIKQPSLYLASEIAQMMGCTLDELVHKEEI